MLQFFPFLNLYLRLTKLLETFNLAHMLVAPSVARYARECAPFGALNKVQRRQ